MKESNGTQPSAAISHVLGFLKSHIKYQKFNYSDLATELDVSEATIKRMLNSGNMDLSRLEQLAGVLGFDLLTLLNRASTPTESVMSLTLEQEERLAEIPGSFTFFQELREGKTPQDIAEANEISDLSMRKYLKHLEDLKLIEVLPHDKVKVLVTGWMWKFQQDGPLNEFIYEKKQALLRKNMDARGQPDVFKHATANGWLGRYFTVHMTDDQYTELLTDMEHLLRKHQQVSAANSDYDSVKPVTISSYVDQFDIYDGVMPEIVEI